MSLASTLSLKKDDGTSQDFVTVDQAPNLPGTLRKNTALDAPESSSLLIRSQKIGSKASSAQRHTVTVDRTVYNNEFSSPARGSASLSLVFPDSPFFTTQILIDIVHQLLDVVISTGTFDVDDTVIAAMLRGES